MLLIPRTSKLKQHLKKKQYIILPWTISIYPNISSKTSLYCLNFECTTKNFRKLSIKILRTNLDNLYIVWIYRVANLVKLEI